MTHPLINILIRNKHRPEEFKRCIESVEAQTYKNVNIIFSEELNIGNNDSLSNIARIISYDQVMDYNFERNNHFWNLYCNPMKAMVTDGWFFFLDNDDYLSGPTILEELSRHLFEGALIVQFLRNGRIKKPTDRMIRDKTIKYGVIGGGCLVLHHSFASVADWEDKPGADYRWIKAVTDKVQTRFVPLVLQIAGNGGLHGK